MGFVVGLFLFVLGLLAIASTFKKPKNEDEAKKLEMFKKHKWKYRIGGYFLMSIGFVLMFPDTLPSTNTSQSTSQTKQAVEIADTSKSTVQTSNQQEAKQTQASSVSGTNLKKAVVSFYKQNYPEATIGGGNNDAIIQFPYKNTTLTVDVGDISDGVFTVNCFMGMRLARNLGSKECLSTEDKAGRSIIDAFYHIYHIKKPSEEEFIKYIRHECIDMKCAIIRTVIGSDNKKYVLGLYSKYSPNSIYIRYVDINVY